MASSDDGEDNKSKEWKEMQEVKDDKKDKDDEKEAEASKPSIDFTLEFLREHNSEIIYHKRSDYNCVFFPTQEDKNLFLEVLDWQKKNRDSDIDAALVYFAKKGNKNWDACVKIAYKTQFVDYILKFEDQNTYTAVRAAWEAKVLKRGLFLEHDAGTVPSTTYVKVVTPFSLLCEEAEIRKLKYPLLDQGTIEEKGKTSYIQAFLDIISLEDTVVPDSAASFKRSKINMFIGGVDTLHPINGADPATHPEVVRFFFRRSHRQLMTYEMLRRVILTPTEVKELKAPKLPSGLKSNFGIRQMLSIGYYTQFFPLHDGSYKSKQANPNMRTYLKENWSKSLRYQPLDLVRGYFGEKLALYFAFLGFYTSWLWIPAVIGLVLFFYGIGNITQNDLPTARLFDNAAMIPWAVIMSLWATIFMEYWKRKNAYLAWWWKMLDYEEEEPARPEWYGTRFIRSPVTGKREPHYPDHVRLAKLAVSTMVIGIAVIVVVVSLMATIAYRVWVQNNPSLGNCILQPKPLQNHPCFSFNYTVCEQHNDTVTDNPDTICTYDNSTGKCVPDCAKYIGESSCMADSYYDVDPSVTQLQEMSNVCAWQQLYYVSTVTTAIVNLVVIVVLNVVYTMIAFRLNEWENHKTDTQYEDALIAKTFFFQFLNSYSSLFYIAFFKGTLASKVFGRDDLRDYCQYGSCITELMIQLAIIFVGKQVINQFQEVLLPLVMAAKNAKLIKRRKEQMQQRFEEFQKLIGAEKDEGPVEDKSLLGKPPQWTADETLGAFSALLFEDYNEIALQFGFITLFVAAFPLAPFFALLNNLVEIRSDAYKYLTGYQRPPAWQAEDIGMWEVIFQTLGLMSVITNAFIVSFSSAWLNYRVLNLDPSVPQIPSDEETKRKLLIAQLVVVLVFEHGVFFAKWLFAYLIPDVPGPVAVAIERENYLARLALEGAGSVRLDEGQDYPDDDNGDEAKKSPV